VKTQAPSLDDKPITALLFDVDGTLYVSSLLRRAILIRLLRRYWKSPAVGYRAARVISAYRNALETLRTRTTSADIESAQIQLTTENTGLSVKEVSEIVEEWFRREPIKVLRSCVQVGLADFLACASASSVKMGIVSDYEAAAKLDALGISGYFDAVVTPRTTGRLKPHPEVLQRALELLRADPEQTLYIGDRVDVDVPAARNAGIRCAILTSRFSERAPFTQFRKYQDLADLLWPGSLLLIR
jgi:HAD superfamily hydrolase (TIGR01549 family)